MYTPQGSLNRNKLTRQIAYIFLYYLYLGINPIFKVIPITSASLLIKVTVGFLVPFSNLLMSVRLASSL